MHTRLNELALRAGCGPCRMIAPIIDELANEYEGKLKCVKLNTDESPQVATDYGIRSIPTVSAEEHLSSSSTVNAGLPAPGAGTDGDQASVSVPSLPSGVWDLKT